MDRQGRQPARGAAEQLKEVLGGDLLGKLAGQLGVDPAQASGQLASTCQGWWTNSRRRVSRPNGLGDTGDLMGMLGGLLQQK